MSKNYYIILGIPEDSSPEDIRAAYRRLAKEYHPDHYGKDQAPFQILQEAYAILSSPKSRKSYDRSLQLKSRVSNAVKHTSKKRYTNIDIEPLIPESGTCFSNLRTLNRSFHQQRSVFEDIFGRFVRRNNEVYDSDMMLAQEFSVEIALSSAQAQRGGNARVDLPIQLNCPACYRYSGHGFVCWRCKGTGILRKEMPLLISYPAGVLDNHVVRLRLNTIEAGEFFLSVMYKIR